MSWFSWLFSLLWFSLASLPLLKEPIVNPLSLSYSHPSLNFHFYFISFSFLLLSLINYINLHTQPSCSSFSVFPPPPHSLPSSSSSPSASSHLLFISSAIFPFIQVLAKRHYRFSLTKSRSDNKHRPQDNRTILWGSNRYPRKEMYWESNTPPQLIHDFLILVHARRLPGIPATA